MGLAWASLSIGKDSSIVTIEHWLDDWSHGGLVYLDLSSGRIEGSIKRITYGLYVTSDFVDALHRTRLVVFEVNTKFISSRIKLPWIERSEPTKDPNICITAHSRWLSQSSGFRLRGCNSWICLDLSLILLLCFFNNISSLIFFNLLFLLLLHILRFFGLGGFSFLHKTYFATEGLLKELFRMATYVEVLLAFTFGLLEILFQVLRHLPTGRSGVCNTWFETFG